MTVIVDELWIVEANGAQIIRIAPYATVGRAADLSPAPSGGVYVATMGAGTPLDRMAKVMDISPNDHITDVWIDLLSVVGLALNANDTLYALETAVGNGIRTTVP